MDTQPNSRPENCGLAADKTQGDLLEYQNRLRAMLETAYATLHKAIALKLDTVHETDSLEGRLQDGEETPSI